MAFSHGVAVCFGCEWGGEPTESCAGGDSMFRHVHQWSNDGSVLQGLVGITSNPVLANGIAGLATTATAFAAVERTLLYQMRNFTVEPFNETVQQVFSRISALRDSLDGPQVNHSHLYTSLILICCVFLHLTIVAC